MNFKPLNRHVLLFPVENVEEEKSTILVPDDYIKIRSSHETYTVMAIARDCEKMSDSDIDCQVVVNNSLVEELKVRGETYYLLLENYVYGVFH